MRSTAYNQKDVQIDSTSCTADRVHRKKDESAGPRRPDERILEIKIAAVDHLKSHLPQMLNKH